MDVQSTSTTESIRYSVLYRIGHFGSLVARCETVHDQGPDWATYSHHVRYFMRSKYGDHFPFGYSIFNKFNGQQVSDEDGELFPDLGTAIRNHAAQFVTVTEVPTEWTDNPPVQAEFVDPAIDGWEDSLWGVPW